jgi:hypothetical protein
MKIKKYKPSEERTILTGMISHDGILDRIAKNLKGDTSPFRSKWTNLVAQWCLNHHSEFHRAPRAAITDLFQRFSQTSQDGDSVELVESFLEGLSQDHAAVAEELNEPFVIDMASRHFRSIRLEKTAKQIEAALERNDPEDAEAALTSYRPIQFAADDWINPFDDETIQRAMAVQEDNSLIHYPGDLEKFLSPFFERDGFISFAGPEKRGKSYWLMDAAYRAIIQKRRTLYYVVGDMSETQVMRRFIRRATRRPFRAGYYDKPTLIKKGPDGPIVDRQRKDFPDDLTIDAVRKAMDRILVKTATRDSRLKIRCVASSMISAGDIDRDISDLTKTDWVPDVVVVDYADVLEPEAHTKAWAFRDQINETWKVLRRISQKYHILLVTATQTDANSYDANIIGKKNFSEDKRKIAHVTGMLGLNQTSEEKKQGLYRLNWMALREGQWSDTQTIWVAGDLSIASPCIISSL